MLKPSLILVIGVAFSLFFCSPRNSFSQTAGRHTLQASKYARLGTTSELGYPGDIVADSSDETVFLGNINEFMNPPRPANAAGVKHQRVGTMEETLPSGEALAHVEAFLRPEDYQLYLLPGNIKVEFSDVMEDSADVNLLNAQIRRLEGELPQALALYAQGLIIASTVSSSRIRLTFDTENMAMLEILFPARSLSYHNGRERLHAIRLTNRSVEIAAEDAITFGIRLSKITLVGAARNHLDYFSFSFTNLLERPSVTIAVCRCKSCATGCSCCPRQRASDCN